jgi:hypothetical protein
MHPGTRDAGGSVVLRGPSEKSNIGTPIRPLPVVAVGAPRHVPKPGHRTEIGLGTNLVDHAAGLPLDARTSAPDLSPDLSGVRTRPSDRPGFGWQEPASDYSPVVLPMSKVWVALLTVFGLALVPAGILIALLSASSRPGDALQQSPSRTEAISPSSEAAPAETAAPSASAPAEAAPQPSSTASSEERSQHRTAAKQSARPKPATVRRIEVPRRAPASATIKRSSESSP